MPMAPRTSSVRQWSETLASSIGSSGRDDELGRNSWKKIYPPGRVVEGTMGLLMWGAVAGAVLNIVLTALLASVYARGLQVRPGAVAPCNADRPGAGLLGGTHIVLRVSDDDAFGRGDAESPRRLQDGIGKGLLARNGVAAQDEGEERQQRRDTEG